MILLHTFTSVNNFLISWSQSLVFFVNYLAVALGRDYLAIDKSLPQRVLQTRGFKPAFHKSLGGITVGLRLSLTK